MTFETYRQVYQTHQIEHIIELLEANNIPYHVEQSETIIDEAIVGNSAHPPVILKVPAADFGRLSQLITDRILQENTIPEEYYLEDFSEEELRDILVHKNEWTPEDFAYAQLMLEKRGVSVDMAAIEAELEADRAKKRAGKPVHLGWFVFYWLLVLVGAVLYFPLAYIAGTGMGFYYWKGYRVEDDGNRYPIFDKVAQGRGKYLFWIGLALCVLVTVFWIVYLNSIVIG